MKSLENATARPWRYTRNDVKKEYGAHHDNIFIRSGEKVICEVWEENEANAALIVRCVNSHDALVEACYLAVESLENEDCRTAVQNEALKSALNALKLARGE